MIVHRQILTWRHMAVGCR